MINKLIFSTQEAENYKFEAGISYSAKTPTKQIKKIMNMCECLEYCLGQLMLNILFASE